MKPAARKHANSHAIFQHGLSERQACRLVGLSRTGYRYQYCARDDETLRGRLKEFAKHYPRYSSLLLHGMLKAEGLVVNKKRTYRLYIEESLQVQTKRHKKLVRPRLPMAVPLVPNERWFMDFVSDQLANGRRFRVLNIVDDFSREIVGQLVDTSISSSYVARFNDRIIEARGKPKAVICAMAQNSLVKQCSFR